MASDGQHTHGEASAEGSVELPRPTAAPLVLAVGLAMLGLGVATSPAFLVVGVVVLVVGLGLWIGQFAPGRGHVHEPLVAPEAGPRPITPQLDGVEQLRPGVPGYRMRMPEHVHPISAGVKGGIVGGIAMLAPAMAYGIVSGHGIWYPANLLTGMVLPGVGDMTVEQLEQLHPTLLAVAIAIHVSMSLSLGLIYGVLMPTLPRIPKPIALGGLLMPVLWTGASFLLLRLVNPLLYTEVDWPWFIASQFVFGIMAALIYARFANRGSIQAGVLGGIVGGLLMPIPAVIWGLLSGNGIWYPLNLLAGMVIRGVDAMPPDLLRQYHGEWLAAAIALHAAFSIIFGLLFGMLLPRLRPMPAPLAWGGLVLPLLWTGSSYGLMGVVNPILQQRVDWPWFIVSQFVFGIVAAIVVLRSEMVYIQPAGPGPDKPSE
jgi:hypothetical protein